MISAELAVLLDAHRAVCERCRRWQADRLAQLILWAACAPLAVPAPAPDFDGCCPVGAALYERAICAASDDDGAAAALRN